MCSKPTKLISILVLILICCTFNVEGKHIIGGVMYYEFVGNQGGTNTYRIIMKMYRDCKPEANKANFDGLLNEIGALGTIYLGNSKSPLREFDFGVPIVGKVSADVTNKCLVVPKDVCVEEGVYTTTISLPVSTQSYFIVYQRCCRNNTISNIVRPGDTGATFMVEITPASQNNQNSSPQFSLFPPIAICANFPIEFDHSAFDKDGDSLVYSLCAPFEGGGNDDTGVNGCLVVAPQPDCPPPFDEVTFRNPYSILNPLGGPNPLVINSVTGRLSGTPTTTGQFVVGIRIREYRNGILLSETRRDFQFNVTSCSKTVDALIEAAGVKGKNLDIKLCGDDELKVAFAGEVTKDIFEISWVFNHNGIKQLGATKDYLLNTSDLGLYVGKLYLNPGQPCSDSASIKVNVFPDIRADFTFDYDTCYGKDIQFTNQSVSDAGPITGSQWKANNVVFSTSFDATYDVLKPDFYEMMVVVTDQNQCMDSITKRIPFFPIPRDELVDPGSVVGCEPFAYTFKKPNSFITDQYKVEWEFGDGESGTGLTPLHVYEKPGIYSVKVTVTNVFGCATSEEFNNTITVKQSPVAGFTFQPALPSNLEPTLTFTDESKYGSYWFYDFGNGDFSSDRNPVYTYPDTGVYQMLQIVTHENGCVDSLIVRVDVAPKYTLFLPNALHPGSPAGNDSYGPIGVPFGIKQYKMRIYDRWGNNVFTTDNFNTRWDGKNGKGDTMERGVYSVRVDIVEARGKEKTIYGKAILIQ